MKDKFMYSYDDLVLFAKVIDIGSFFHAGKLLNMSHTTISRRMKILEERLGVILLKVDTQGFEVTALGKQLYDGLKGRANDFDTFVNSVIEHKNEPSGTIKVQLPVAISQELITPHIPSFVRKYPKINLIISYQNGEVDLIKDGFHVAIVNYIPKQQTIKIKNVLTSSLKLYCTKIYANKYGVPINFDELSNHLVTGFMINNSIVNNIRLTNIKTNAEIVVPMPGHVVLDNDTHSKILLNTNEMICAIFDCTKNYLGLGSNEIIPVLPDYAVSNVKFYMIRHPQADDICVQLVSAFLENCLKLSETNNL